VEVGCRRELDVMSVFDRANAIEEEAEIFPLRETGEL
jgi:hypothetical protein